MWFRPQSAPNKLMERLSAVVPGKFGCPPAIYEAKPCAYCDPKSGRFCLWNVRFLSHSQQPDLFKAHSRYCWGTVGGAHRSFQETHNDTRYSRKRYNFELASIEMFMVNKIHWHTAPRGQVIVIKMARRTWMCLPKAYPIKGYAIMPFNFSKSAIFQFQILYFWMEANHVLWNTSKSYLAPRKFGKQAIYHAICFLPSQSSCH